MATLNFAEVWLNRVINRLTTADAAPWLDGIPELDTEVIEVGSGSASEKNIIHIPTSTFQPEVLIDNTNDLDIEAYTDSEVTISLNKYQTKATSLTDDQVMGAAYDRIDNATRSHVTAISEKKYARSIWNFCPSANTAATPIISTTGDGVTSGSGKRKRLKYDDLVALKDAFDKNMVPVIGRRLVLCTDHWNDLLLDRANFGNLLVNYTSGTVVPVLAGFEIHQYVANPLITLSGLTRKAFGTAGTAGDYQASVAFYTSNVAKKTGLTKQYFQPAEIDPIKQRNLINYRHYFIATPKEAKYVGAIVSGETA